MPPSSGDNASSNDAGGLGRGNNPSGPARNPPLVIVSERGRHSEASRRIVRAQAARASAAQSRETRARNREDRHARDGPRGSSEGAPSGASRPQLTARYSHQPQQTTPQQQQSYLPQQQQQQHQQSYQQQHSQQQQQQQQAQSRIQYQYQQPRQDQDQTDNDGVLKPLVNWITNVLHLTAASFVTGVAALATGGHPQLGNANEVLSGGSGYIADSGLEMEEVQVSNGPLSRRLPIALPRGFSMLQSRISISDGFMVLLSRTACFDYASSGVENRLNELLFDIVMNNAAEKIIEGQDLPEHPIQKHLRLACVCLTIFQGQRADGATFAGNQNYDLGLQAVWDEALVLDQDALKDQKSAEAALWAVFVISVTCGSTVKFFHQLLYNLMQDLQLAQWNQVRNVLLDFIYPGSFIDAPMQQFFNQLHSDRSLQVQVAG